MSVVATTCPKCARTVFLAKNAGGQRVVALELLERAYRIEGDRMVPCAGVYVDHAGRCPGDLGSVS